MKNNILIIIADQLTWRALPVYGDRYAKTPNIDRIADGAAVFDACYTSCPLCQPARTSFWSSLYPHQTEVLSNGRQFPVTDLPETVPTLGSVFQQAGYETVHFGKKHDAGGLRGFLCEPENHIEVEADNPAFPVGMDTYRDRYTTVKAVEYLEQKTDSKPFLMVADYVNPHDICSYVGHNKYVHANEKIAEDFVLPQLPDNFEFDDIENRPVGVQYICCSHNRQSQAAGWTPENYQYYLAAYYHYIGRVDHEIGQVLDALEKGGKAEDTLVVFMADHGDGMASRGHVTKQVNLYEEITRIPFLFKGKGIVASKERIADFPVSVLDLFPTLCNYADISAPDGLMGMSLLPALQGDHASLKMRSYVASEWHTEWGYTISPGRMIRNARYKYTKYIEDNAEELFDLQKDPGEKKNRAGDPTYQVALDEMRALYRQYLSETKDPFEQMEWKADKRWRSHPLGYQNHVGIAAPMEY